MGCGFPGIWPGGLSKSVVKIRIVPSIVYPLVETSPTGQGGEEVDRKFEAA